MSCAARCFHRTGHLRKCRNIAHRLMQLGNPNGCKPVEMQSKRIGKAFAGLYGNNSVYTGKSSQVMHSMTRAVSAIFTRFTAQMGNEPRPKSKRRFYIVTNREMHDLAVNSKAKSKIDKVFNRYLNWCQENKSDYTSASAVRAWFKEEWNN